MTAPQKPTESKSDSASEFLYADLTYTLNGILIEAYKELGKYAREKQYGNAVAEKFEKQGISFAREQKSAIQETSSILLLKIKLF